MWKYFQTKLDRALETLRAFFQESNPAGSSKRLTFIASFFNGIAICWFALLTGVPIDSTVLSLSISLITISSGSYLIGKKDKSKSDVTTDVKGGGEKKDGQG